MEDTAHPMHPSTAQTHSQPESRSHTGSELFQSLTRYKRWADSELVQAALALPADFPAKEAGYVTAIIRHYHTVDCIFRAHLLGIPHNYSSPKPPEPATLAELRPRVAEVDQWYVDYASQLSERELGEAVRVKFTDGQEQTLKRSDILLYILQHGTGHRGQVSLFMQLYGVQPPPDRFTNYLRTAAEH